MRRVALKGLWLRRGRAVLTALAVVLGVAMVSGTYVLTDTISKAFDAIFETGASRTSAVITGERIVETSSSGAATIPASLLDRVESVGGVEDAAGAISTSGSATGEQIRLVGPGGESLGNENAPKLGVGINPEDTRFNPLTLTTGRWAEGGGEVVIDQGTAEEEDIGVGDPVGVAARGGVQDFEVVGVARFGEVSSLGGATIGVFDLQTAQQLLDKEDQFDMIYVAAAPGTSPEALVEELEPIVPEGAVARTADAQAAEESEDIQEATSFIRYFLLAFGIIALGVGAFVIYNTLSITVAQRIRELATLRTLGASRRQVRRSVLIEGLAIGIVASLTGLVLGYFLAQGLTAVFKGLGIDLPQTEQVVKARTVVVSLAVGIVVTVIASLSPAKRATTISPVAALQDGATLPPRLSARRPAVPGGVLALAAALLGTGALAGLEAGLALLALGLGTLALFVGLGMVAGRFVGPIVRVVGVPARRAGGTAGRLAGENATRNPARTAATAAALMIGLALVTLVATLGHGLRTSDRQYLEDSVRADYTITSANGFDTIPAAADRAVDQLPGAEAYPVRFDSARAFGDDVPVHGLPAGAADVVRVNVSGGPALPGPGEALVESGYAEDNGLAVGDTFTITAPSGEETSLRVSALQERTSIESIDPLFGRVLLSQETFDQAFPRPSNQFVFVAGDVSRDELAQAVARFPDTEVYTREAWIDERVGTINTLLNLLYVLLALSVVVSLFGMVNTLVLSVFERTREIGMLRAVGMSRRQVRRMVRHESVITALIGAALGLPLGLLLAALMSSALADEGLTFAVPLGSLVAFTVVAVIAGILAAIAPARRAARLDVLRALQYE